MSPFSFNLSITRNYKPLLSIINVFKVNSLKNYQCKRNYTYLIISNLLLKNSDYNSTFNFNILRFMKAILGKMLKFIHKLTYSRKVARKKKNCY